MRKKELALAVIERLKQEYPDAGCSLAEHIPHNQIGALPAHAGQRKQRVKIIRHLPAIRLLMLSCGYLQEEHMTDVCLCCRQMMAAIV